jgi:putative flippase GtrA
MQIQNDWLRRGVRGAVLAAVLYIMNMVLPISYLMQGPIGTSIYYIITFVVSGFVMWHILDNVKGKA